MENKDNSWASKMMYREINNLIPPFKDLSPQDSIVGHDTDGTLSYKITTDQFDRLSYSITEDLFKEFFTSLEDYLGVKFDFMEKDRTQNGQVNYWLQDIKNNKLHHVAIDKEKGTIDYLYSDDVKYNDRGTYEFKGRSLDKIDLKEMLNSEEFKSNFTSLHQDKKM